MDKWGHRPKMELRTLRIYGSTNQSINQSIVHIPHYVITYYRSYGLVDLYTDLRGCLWIYTTELAYSLSKFVWLYTVHIWPLWTEIQENNTCEVKIL